MFVQNKLRFRPNQRVGLYEDFQAYTNRELESDLFLIVNRDVLSK